MTWPFFIMFLCFFGIFQGESWDALGASGAAAIFSLFFIRPVGQMTLSLVTFDP